MMNTTESILSQASDQLKKGLPVLIFDDAKREGESDMIYASQYVTPEAIRMLRTEAGGLICQTLKEEDAAIVNLPFTEDLYRRFLPYGYIATDTSDMKYDTHSSFSFTINHRDTYTGITDKDRAKTITSVVEFLTNPENRENSIEKFYSEFRIPGHVHLILARKGYFTKRRGHTELSTYLMEKLDLFPSATLAEMLSPSGNAMTHDEAMRYASKNGLIFIEGKDIIDEWTND